MYVMHIVHSPTESIIHSSATCILFTTMSIIVCLLPTKILLYITYFLDVSQQHV